MPNDRLTEQTEQPARQKEIKQDGICLDVEVSGRCENCDEDLVKSEITPQLVCPECGASYVAKYQILSVNRSEDTKTALEVND